MKRKLKLSTFQIRATRKRVEELRIGATRRPPRGVPRKRWTKDGYFDVWLPVVAPSQKLITRFKRDFDDPARRRAFFDRYERELLSNTAAKYTLRLLAEIAKRTPVSIGCYCANESRCHRSRLFKIISRLATQR
jgi:uncharacterized protein YeaO (DUF488 family)